MGTMEFRFADKGAQIRKINRFLVIGVLVFSIFTTGIMVGSYINGHRSLAYLAFMAGFMLLSNVVNFIMFVKVPQSLKRPSV